MRRLRRRQGPCPAPIARPDAAERVRSARAADMLTTEEWDGLEHAVADANAPDPGGAGETFAVEEGYLVRRVVPRQGTPYVHRCPAAAFEEVAHAAGECGAEGFTNEDLRYKTGIPWSQVAVAVAFLKERGIAVPAGRKRHKAASPGAFEDAMCEYHALYEEPEAEARMRSPRRPDAAQPQPPAEAGKETTP